MDKELKNEEIVLTPQSHIDASEFEWVGQDVEKSEEISRPSMSFWQDAWLRIKREKVAVAFLVILGVIALFAIVVPFISPYSLQEQHYQHTNAGILFKDETCFHIFGTDSLGRDMFVRIWEGGRISLLIALVTVLANGVIGVVYGGVSGYFGGFIDNIMMRIVEVINGIPYLLVVILLMTIMEGGVITIIIAMVSTGWGGMARLVRGEVIRLKEQEFVIAAQSMGGSATRIIFKHLFPNVLSIVIVNLTLAIPSAIFSEAFLSFIGLGVQVPLASWGTLCQDGIANFRYYPEQLFFPAFFISLTMLSFNLLGDKLRDAFDPKLRR